MNKKAVAVFLISMVLVASLILGGIKLFRSDFLNNLFSSKQEETTAITITTEISETTDATTAIPLSFQSEAEAMNYVASYASNNGIDINSYPQRLYTLLVHNPDALDFVLNYPLNVSTQISGSEENANPSETTLETEIVETEPSITSIVSLEGEITTARITTLYTWDERWGYTEYGNGQFCFTGSAPTCVSMCAMYLLRNPALSPQWIAMYSMGNGYCNDACDGSHESSLVGDGGYGLGINVTQIPSSDEDRIKRNLDVPNPIICDVGDHYIILISYEDEEFTVIDPTSEYNTNRTWSWTELSSCLEGLWVYRVL